MTLEEKQAKIRQQVLERNKKRTKSMASERQKRHVVPVQKEIKEKKAREIAEIQDWHLVAAAQHLKGCNITQICDATGKSYRSVKRFLKDQQAFAKAANKFTDVDLDKLKKELKNLAPMAVGIIEKVLSIKSDNFLTLQANLARDFLKGIGALDGEATKITTNHIYGLMRTAIEKNAEVQEEITKLKKDEKAKENTTVVGTA